MSESTSVTNHINNLNTLFAQLSAADFNIIENERAELLPQSLHDSYDQLVINITNYNIIDLLRFEDVVGAVLEEESRRKNKEDMVERTLRHQPHKVVWQIPRRMKIFCEEEERSGKS